MTLSDSRGGGGADAASDADTEAFLERLRRMPPPEESAEMPAVPGVTILELVGRGGMGDVYRGRETAGGGEVAVKVLRGLGGTSAAARARREGQILSGLAHPNIVRVLRCGACAPPVPGADPLPAIVMEWMEGGTLERFSGRERLRVDDAVRMVRDLARAVAEVHSLGIVHRDIKPANVLLGAPGATGAPPVPKLADFGLARRDGLDTRVTRDGTVLGTPGYLAPEQAAIDPTLGGVGPATDIHGLGGVLYWLLSGRAPYEGHSTAATLQRAARGDGMSLAAIVPRLPSDLLAIVERCLALRPGHRYRSAGALADDLDRFLAGRPVHARRAGFGSRLARWSRRHPAAAAVVASALVGTIALVAMSVHYVRGLARANAAIAASRDRAVAAENLARRSFDRLTDDSAGRLIARGHALDDDDREHLRRIRDQYRQWPLEPDDASGLRFRAAGLERLARIFVSLHWPDDAITSLEAALECLDDLAARGHANPTDDGQRRDLELLECGLLISAGRLDDAARVAASTIEHLEERLGTRPDAGRHLPGALSGLAIVEHQRGNATESAAHFGRAIDLCERMLSECPDDPEILRLALPVYFNAASTSSFASDARVRRELFSRVVALAEDGLGRFDSDREFLGSSAIMGLAALVDIDLQAERPDTALVTADRQMALARRLAVEMPDSEPMTNAAMLAANQAYLCHAALGRPGDAENDLAEAVAAAERAVAVEPALVSRSRVLAWLLQSQAGMYLGTGRPSEALASLRRGVEVLEPWTRGPEADGGLIAKAAGMRRQIESLAETPAEGRREDGVGPPADR